MADMLIKATQLSKTFGAFTAVDNIDLTVKRGEVLGFLGPNGAGKTTTMRMLTGYLPPTTGNITIHGESVLDAPEKAQRSIGYLPEGAPLYPDMTPHQILSFIGELRGMRPAFFRTQYERVIAHLSLERVLYQPIDTLSKGFKRRVGLAQAILHDPDVLILDEPTDGLDPLQKREVRTLIASMAANKAIIISTHILEEVDAVCHRAVIISHGRIVANDTPEALRYEHNRSSLDDIFCHLATHDAAKGASA